MSDNFDAVYQRIKTTIAGHELNETNKIILKKVHSREIDGDKFIKFYIKNKCWEMTDEELLNKLDKI